MGKDKKEAENQMQEHDHKKLGPQLELFYIDPVVGKGLPQFLPKGATVYRELERFIIDEELKRGYQHVRTPDIAKLELYEKSGHYPYYKDSMYAPIDIDDEQFMLRPMTCPHHYQMFKFRPRSYRELPLRLAEVSGLYRYEQSGELMGLQRVRAFRLSDAHIFCATEEQAVSEMGSALDLIEYVAGVLGLTLGKEYWYRLSLGDRGNKDKYYGSDEAWEMGENLIREHLKKRGSEFVEAKDEAAFYGPKIDVQMKNVNGKEDTAFTVQYDFCMPDKFDLNYIDTDGSEKRVFVVHRSSIGALERSIAFLIEQYAGAFPLWLAPIQVKILPIGEAHHTYAQSVCKELRSANIRVELDEGDETLGKKIRNAKLEKVPIYLVIGDDEVSGNSVSVEYRDGSSKKQVPLASLITELAENIARRKH